MTFDSRAQCTAGTVGFTETLQLSKVKQMGQNDRAAQPEKVKVDHRSICEIPAELIATPPPKSSRKA
jgi:hypothetical protein